MQVLLQMLLLALAAAVTVQDIGNFQLTHELTESLEEGLFVDTDNAWVADMKEDGVSTGYGNLGKNGALGFEGGIIKIDGKLIKHSLSMHPPSRGDAYVEYSIGKKWKRLEGSVGVNNGDNTFDYHSNYILFVVEGDGKEIWTSPKVTKWKDVFKYSANVEGVEKLRLIIRAPSSNACAHGVFIDPKLEA
jgi:hypothetical protein